jgi:mannose PTS system EIIA component
VVERGGRLISICFAPIYNLTATLARFSGDLRHFCRKRGSNPVMAGILIIAHAPFATALRECIAHFYGGLPARIGCIDVMPDCDPVEVRAFARSEIERLKEDNGTLVLTDMFGATPANIAASLHDTDVRVLAGCNLPMVVRAVCYRAIPLDMLAEKILQGGAKGIQEIDESTPLNPCALAAKAAAGSADPACAATVDLAAAKAASH